MGRGGSRRRRRLRRTRLRFSFLADLQRPKSRLTSLGFLLAVWIYCSSVTICSGESFSRDPLDSQQEYIPERKYNDPRIHDLPSLRKSLFKGGERKYYDDEIDRRQGRGLLNIFDLRRPGKGQGRPDSKKKMGGKKPKSKSKQGMSNSKKRKSGGKKCRRSSKKGPKSSKSSKERGKGMSGKSKKSCPVRMRRPTRKPTRIPSDQLPTLPPTSFPTAAPTNPLGTESPTEGPSSPTGGSSLQKNKGKRPTLAPFSFADIANSIVPSAAPSEYSAVPSPVPTGRIQVVFDTNSQAPSSPDGSDESNDYSVEGSVDIIETTIHQGEGLPSSP